MKKLSICIPTFNRGKYLENLLDILINLKISNYEIIVVDNKSTDNTIQIFKKEKYKLIKFFQNKENIGMVGNWNRCIELASGEYVIIIHADDLVSPELFVQYQKALEKVTDACIIFSYPNIINENSEIIGNRKILKGNLIFKGALLFRLLLMTNFIHASCILVKRECYYKKGNFSNKYQLLPDFDMWLRITIDCTCIYVDKPLFSYRIHPENIFSKIDRKTSFREYKDVLKNVYFKLNPEIPKDKWIRDLIEYTYRFKYWKDVHNKIDSINRDKIFKKIIKFDLKYFLKVVLGYMKAIIQKPQFFETKKFRKTYYAPMWKFSLLLKYYIFHFLPFRGGKRLINVFKSLKII